MILVVPSARPWSVNPYAPRKANFISQPPVQAAQESDLSTSISDRLSIESEEGMEEHAHQRAEFTDRRKENPAADVTGGPQHLSRPNKPDLGLSGRHQPGSLRPLDIHHPAVRQLERTKTKADTQTIFACCCGAAGDTELGREPSIQCTTRTCLQWSHLACQEGLEGYANTPGLYKFQCHHCVCQVQGL